jgi:hypothetical protein
MLRSMRLRRGNAVPIVAILTKDETFSDALVAAYRARGYEVFLGLSLPEDAARPNIVHLHWPEEHAGWGAGSASEHAEIVNCLRAQTAGALVIGEAHNIRPHKAKGDEFRDLYLGVYGLCDLIGHCSKSSLENFKAAYPELAGKRHVTHPPFSYRSAEIGVAVNPRAADGVARIAVLGALRRREELLLALCAYAACNVPQKALRLNTRLSLGRRPERAIYKAVMGLWPNVSLDESYLSARAFDDAMLASDVVLVPRLAGHNNSGLLYHAVELGRCVVAPDDAATRELLGDTCNPLYTMGDWRSAARALEQAFELGPDAIGRENAKLARGWGWAAILDAYAGHAPLNAQCNVAADTEALHRAEP